MIITFMILMSIGIIFLLAWLKIFTFESAIAVAMGFFLISSTTALIAYHSDITDTEILSGQITDKKVWRFTCPTNTINPCRNGYDCHCRTIRYACGTSDKGRTRYCTRRECDTCYTYPWEQNWYVNSTVFQSMEISREDRQGAIMPNRYKIVQPGDPASVTNSYTNWVKAAYNSLFHEDETSINEKIKATVPSYPDKIFDYYKIKRTVTIGYTPSNINDWNEGLSKTLRILGAKKQINVIVVMYKGFSDNYPIVVRNVWRGFKKNDAVIFLRFDADNTLDNVQVMSWSKKDMYNVVLRDNIYERFVGTNIENVDEFMKIVNDTSMEHYVRRSMEEFEYLKDDIAVKDYVYYVAFITFFLALGIGYYLTSRSNVGYNSNTFSQSRLSQFRSRR